MIEVLFGESEAGSMKVAKHERITEWRRDGPTAMIGEAPVRSEKAEGIVGNPSEVICLGFMMDIGDIKAEVVSAYRKRLIFSMLYQEQWENEPEMEEELKRLGDFYDKELKRLKAYLEEGEEIRIWYSDAPYSRCGFYFVCQWMKKYENQVSVVKLPEYRVRENSITFYHNWGNMPAEEFSYFLQFEKVLSKRERKMYESLWRELVEENAPLRAVVNGQVIGVREDFYDFLIWKRLTDQPVKEARLIGDILGHYPVSVGDWWYASRIDALIAAGKIKVVEDSNRKYARLICRV